MIRGIGIILASLLQTRCTGNKNDKDKATPTEVPVLCYEIVPSVIVEATPTTIVKQTSVLSDVVDGGDINPAATRLVQSASSREMVHALWLQLYTLAKTSGEDIDEGEALKTVMIEQHRSALDDLVSLDELAPAVADQVQVAFEEASFHTWRKNIPVTCYIAVPTEYDARDDLLEQANTLNKFEGTLDAQIIDQAREAVMRDMAFFQAFSSESPGDDLLALWRSGEIEASEEAIAAARFLVELLLNE
jgi:hypothetical protein